MYRQRIIDLHKWKNSPIRKPLLLRGARQVGKTWLMQEFGRTAYRQMVYVNFEDAPTLQNLFLEDFDVNRILTVLGIYAKTNIHADDTLILFDEIQSVPKGITSLKYFCENAPQYHIIAAGSLLGVNLHNHISFPVGKVDFIDLCPLSFCEFLMSLGEELLAKQLEQRRFDILDHFADKLKNYLKYYLYVGGMPEAVNVFAQTKDWNLVRQIQLRILHAYEGDFSKHAPNDIIPRINMVWQSIPRQLSKENKKFIFSVLKEGARAKEFELAVQWLIDTGLLLKINRISKPYLPLIAYQDNAAFKIYMHDVGLLAAMSGLKVDTIIEGDHIFTEFKGALTEQFVMQQLRIHSDDYIAYWTNDRSTAEVDFIVQHNGEIFPVEVKATENLRAKSFSLFCENFKHKTAIRTSLSPYKKESWMTNIPLYAIGCAL